MIYTDKTEKIYIYWIVKFIRFHGTRHPRELGVTDVAKFLNYLATEKRVAPSTQNQALQAILFLYKRVLKTDLGDVDFIRAKKAGSSKRPAQFTF